MPNKMVVGELGIVNHVIEGGGASSDVVPSLTIGSFQDCDSLICWDPSESNGRQ